MAQHGQAAAQLGKLRQARDLLGKVGSQLAELASMGDAVTPEDVVKGAGALVGHGADPMQMAGLLADLPQGGEAISSWLQAHAQTIAQSTAALDQKLAMARHEAGVAALHGIAMHHIGQAFGEASPPPTQMAEGQGDEGNALRPD